MKKFFCGIFVLLAVFCAAQEAGKDGEKAELSYAFGMIVGADLMETKLEFDYDAFMQGFRETMEREKTRYSLDEAMEKIDAAFNAVQAEIREGNRIEGEAFLAENGKRPGVSVTPSGLQYEVVTEGTGEMPGPGSVVLVHYQGATISGAVFDSSYERGEPMEIPLDRVIPGWSEGLRMMREAGKAKLYIPPDLAYGEHGVGIIGPNAVLVFEVELLSIVQPQDHNGD
jgi:FKBP-type peptidyl-prolyl cis-trans isomerase